MPAVSDVTDAELVARAADGERAAFDQLFERHVDTVHDHVARWSRDTTLAADATQEAFVELLRHLDTLRDGQAVLAWLLRTARNRAIDQLRRTERETATSTVPDGRIPGALLTATDRDAAADPETAALSHEAAALVWEVAAGLDERTFTVLDLSVRHGLSGPELAEVMDTTPSNANVLVHRMRERLKLLFGAVLLLRRPGRDCPELESLREQTADPVDLAAARRIEEHATDCPVCGPRRRRAIAPLRAYASLAHVRAPVGVRSGVDAAAAAHFGTGASVGSSALLRRATVAALVLGGLLIVGGIANGLLREPPAPGPPPSVVAEPVSSPAASPSPSPSPGETLEPLPESSATPTPSSDPSPSPDPTSSPTASPSPSPSPEDVPPVVVTLTAPAEGTSLVADQADEDSGRAFSPVEVAAEATGGTPDGTTTFTWTTTTGAVQDAVLLEGASGTVRLALDDACQDTTHQLTVTATDDATGRTASDGVTVQVVDDCPDQIEVTIQSPTDGAAVTADQVERESGRPYAEIRVSATSTSDGQPTWEWTSSEQPDEEPVTQREGLMRLYNTTCIDITHTITVQATDGASSATAQVEVTVRHTCPT